MFGLRLWGELLSLLISSAKILAVISSDDVFLQQPGPGPILAPVTQQVQLNCSVSDDYLIEWEIQFRGTQVRSPIVSELVVQYLLTQGIEILDDTFSDTFSLLAINGTAENNQSFVNCVAINMSRPIERLQGRRVQVTFFHSFVYVGNLAVAENGVNSLRITWAASLGVLQFILTATNLNISAIPVEITGILNTYYTFNTTSITACDTYGFQVTALNMASVASSSEIVVATIPSLPDISLVEATLQHSLTTTNMGASLRVTFNGTNLCPLYPILRFSLVLGLEDSIFLKRTVNPDPLASDNILSIVVDGLTENLQYWYFLSATNRFGDGEQTARINITTTQVQNVTICLVEGNTYSFQCNYIIGSSIGGCVFILTGSEGVERINGTITRSVSDSVEREIPNIGDYSELTVYGLERGGERISIRRAIGFIGVCVVTTSGFPLPLTPVEFGFTLAIVMIGMFGFLLVTWLMYCIIYDRDSLRRLCFLKTKEELEKDDVVVFDGTGTTVVLDPDNEQFPRRTYGSYGYDDDDDDDDDYYSRYHEDDIVSRYSRANSDIYNQSIYSHYVDV